MNTTTSTETWTETWTDASLGLYGPGGSDVRRCGEPYGRVRVGVSPAPCVTPFQGTGAPAGTVLAGAFRATTEPFAHNVIGTTLGIHPSRRPQS